MPYVILNFDSFAALANARFYKVRSVKAIVRTLSRVDFSVVDSRREGHRAFNDFVDKGVDGDSLFGKDVRFVDNDLSDIYISDADGVTQALLVSITTSLSFRQTNKAKDTSAGTGSDKHEGNVEIAFDQGVQDSTKRYEELVKRLSTLANDPGMVWRRGSFEERIATWSQTGTQ